VFIHLNAMALLGMSGASKDMSDDERERTLAVIVRDSAGVLEARPDETGFTFQLCTNLVTARSALLHGFRS
jgi:hypothetical protein